jgi:predicted ArsR family transcriptional regulator
MTPRKETGARIAGLLAAKPLTVPEMAQLLGVDPMGVQSCANAMVRRGELVRLVRKPGQPFVYRLPGKGRAAA